MGGYRGMSWYCNEYGDMTNQIILEASHTTNHFLTIIVHGKALKYHNYIFSWMV